MTENMFQKANLSHENSALRGFHVRYEHRNLEMSQALHARLIAATISLPINSKTYRQIEMKLELPYQLGTDMNIFRIVVQVSAESTFRSRLSFPHQQEMEKLKFFEGQLSLIKTTHQNVHEQSTYQLIDFNISQTLNQLAQSYATGGRFIQKEASTLYVERLGGVDEDIFETSLLSLETHIEEKPTLPPPFHISAYRNVEHFCGCSHERMMGVVERLPVEERLELAVSPGYAEVTCGFCERTATIQLDQHGHPF